MRPGRTPDRRLDLSAGLSYSDAVGFDSDALKSDSYAVGFYFDGVTFDFGGLESHSRVLNNKSTTKRRQNATEFRSLCRRPVYLPKFC
jgi:hypothetical protein